METTKVRIGDTFRFGVLVAEYADDNYWIAYLDGSRGHWAAGKTMYGAIGACWENHHEDISTAIILARDFKDSGQTPGELLRNYKVAPGGEVMNEAEMRRMLTLAHAVIANMDTLLNDSLAPYAAMVRSQAQGWLEQYQALLVQELETLGKKESEVGNGS